MALTLDQLQKQRDDVIADMGKGESRVEFEGRGLTYRTQAESEAALQRIDAEIAKLQSPSQSRQFTVKTSRGL